MLNTVMLGVFGASVACVAEVTEPPRSAQPVPPKIEIAEGPFKPQWESYKQ